MLNRLVIHSLKFYFGLQLTILYVLPHSFLTLEKVSLFALIAVTLTGATVNKSIRKTLQLDFMKNQRSDKGTNQCS